MLLNPSSDPATCNPPPPPPAQIHQRMIPLGGRRYSMCQKGPLEPNRKPVIHKSEGSLRGCLLICEKQSDLESLYGRPFDRALLLCQCSTCSRHWHPLLPSRSLGNHRGGSAPSPMTSLWFAAGSVTRYHSKWVGKTSLNRGAWQIAMISFVILNVSCGKRWFSNDGTHPLLAPPKLRLLLMWEGNG